MSPLTLTLLFACTDKPTDSGDSGCEDPGTWYLDGDEDGFGQAVGYVFDTSYSYGALDVDYAYTSYLGPWYQRFDVTDL